MKKIFLVGVLLSSPFFFSQSYWQRLTLSKEQVKKETQIFSDKYYKLNVSELRKILESGKTSKNQNIIIEIPNLEGKIEKFSVKNFSVMDPQLEEKYHLGSYIGTSLSHPNRTIRLSISPDSFQSTISEGGDYQFIDKDRTQKDVYKVHLKTSKSGVFDCKTIEIREKKQELENLRREAKEYKNSTLFKLRTSDDRKYRTLRLAISVTGEYTQIFGGIAGALAQINATITRVNSVYEKDLALHLNVVNAPQLIFENPKTDPYSDPDKGTEGAWNLELQNELTKSLGEANYDIGHLFGSEGGGGNAGCIGCICVSPNTDENLSNGIGKGSGYTSPAIKNQPYGDEFDIDFVAHELGHQLGANHTFSHMMESMKVQVEPGSGSTIMGYAGITKVADVQSHSDAYFNAASLNQIQLNLEEKVCDIEQPIKNNTPPKIETLPSYTIPKGTPFVLKVNASDAENDSLTYTWEQNDSAKSILYEVVDKNEFGPNFRSMKPSEKSFRYFPNYESVVAGKLVDKDQWETVSNVPREMNFVVTVRDNHHEITSQQVSCSEQKIKVTDDGPFQVTSSFFYVNINKPIQWNIAKTNEEPYHVENVKIDYTTDGGKTWNIISESTKNNGSFSYNFPSSLEGKYVQIRITSIGNIFYTISLPIRVLKAEDCSIEVPQDFKMVKENRKVLLSWRATIASKYIVRYKMKNTNQWTEIKLNEAKYEIIPKDYDQDYEIQVAYLCGDRVGAFTPSLEYNFPLLEYCSLSAKDSTYEYISNVQISDSNEHILLDNSSEGTGYSNYVKDLTKVVKLKKGSKGNKLSVTITYPDDEDYYENISVWVDFNADGLLSEDERIIKEFIPDPSNGNVKKLRKEFTFDVPSGIPSSNEFLRMRIALKVGPSINSSTASACDGTLTGTIVSKPNYNYGEVEDYRVVFE